MLIVLVSAIVLVVSVTFAAIFRHTTTVERIFEVSNFSAQSVVWFEKTVSGSPVIVSSAAYTDSYGVKVSIDPSDDNYLGNLRAKVLFKGAGVGLVRVRMVEEWSTTSNGVRTVQPYNLSMPYTLDNTYTGSGNKKAWLDNRMNDYCFYYTTPVYSAGTSEIPLITGVNMAGLDLGVLPSDTDVHILFETDAVQVNRYQQYWGISALPWTSGVSSTQMELSTVAGS